MNTIPKTDSIRSLAEFWDSHDVTGFTDELEEVTEPVFSKDTVMEVHLSFDEAEKTRKIAGSQGMEAVDLVHEWVMERASLLQQEQKMIHGQD